MLAFQPHITYSNMSFRNFHQRHTVLFLSALPWRHFVGLHAPELS